MKNFILSIAFLLLFPTTFYCQSAFTNPITQATVLIQFSNGGSGSGFLFTDDISVYLVTAKHVLGSVDIKQQKFVLSDTKGYIIGYLNQSFSDEKDSLEVDFQKLYNEGNIKVHTVVDIGVV